MGGVLAWGADWLTDGGNPQRTAWQKDEKILSADSVKNMKLLWKLKLDNEPRQMHSLFPPLIIGHVEHPERPPSRSPIETGVSDNIYAIDVEKGELIWKKHFESTYTPPANGGGAAAYSVPGGITATPVIGPTGTPGKYTIYAASWDGMLHQLNAADGEDVAPPAKFMPPNGKPYALNLWNNVIYTHTAQGCGGNPNMVYSYDLATNKVGILGPCRRRHVGAHRPGHQRRRHHVHGNRRRPVGSRERHLRQRHHRSEAESRYQGAASWKTTTALPTPSGW